MAKIQAITPENGQEIKIVTDPLRAFLESGSVEPNVVERYSDGNDRFASIAITLSWTEEPKACEYEAEIATDCFFNQNVTVFQRQKDRTALLCNPLSGETYFWRVTAYGVNGEWLSSAVFSFRTAKTPRPILIDGISNTRDLGGYRVPNGRVAQGMIYRGAKTETVTEEGKKTVQRLNITTDFDLRKAGEDSAGELCSPLGCARYIHVSSPFYAIFTDEAKADVKKIIQVFSSRENYPIYMHCAIGRDRTGTIAFLINALLGVDRNGLLTDYFLSLFSASGCADQTSCVDLNRHFCGMYDGLESGYEGETYAKKVEHYLLSCGVTQTQIDDIRKIMTDCRQ